MRSKAIEEAAPMMFIGGELVRDESWMAGAEWMEKRAEEVLTQAMKEFLTDRPVSEITIATNKLKLKLKTL